MLRLLAAIPLGLLPGRYWPSLNDRVPIYRGAFFSALATLILALAIGIPGFIRYTHGMLDPATELMLHLYNMRGRAPVDNVSSTTAAIQVIQLSTPLAPVFFMFGTPLGLLCTYLGTSSVIRMVAVMVEDPWGDPLLTIADAVVRRSWTASRARDARILRERREGAEVPDVLVTGASASVADADFVVIASRRKPDWDTGAIVVTDDKWFTLGTPFEQQMPGGWRTLYPLTELHHHEVLRRAVRYTLPPLRGTRSTSAQ